MKHITSTLALLLIVCAASAQFGGGMGPTIAKSKIKVVSGDLASLKGKTFKTEFIYDGMAVGKFDKEEDYVAKRKADLNEKEPGKGDKWALSWKSDRTARYEPSFISKFNELGTETSTQVSNSAGSGGALTIKTTFTEPGFNIGVLKELANINTVCEFKDASGKTLAVVTLDKVPGQTLGGDFDTGVRIGESYEKLGKDLYKTISKKF